MLLLIKYFVTNCDCRHGPGKLQNLFENPPFEASPGQEDELKVIGCVFYLFGQQLRTLRAMLSDTRSFVCRMTLSMSLKSILGLFLLNYFSQLGFYNRAGSKNSFQCLQR